MSIYKEVEDMNIAIEAICNDDVKEEQEKQDLINQLLSMKEETLIDGLNKLTKIKLNFENDIEGIKQEIERLQKRRKTIENNIANIKDYMMLLMKQQQKDKIKTDIFNITIRKTKAVNIIDENKIDERFFMIKKQVDKKTLKEFLQDNICEGAELVENESIVIK